jgi:hypothetical protein
MNRSITVLIFISGLVATAIAQNMDNKQVLDKMYDDIIKSIPASQQALIDSVYTSSQKNQLNGKSTESLNTQINKTGTDNTEDIELPDAINNEIIKMMQQIDTMRQKRIIHFKSTNVP